MKKHTRIYLDAMGYDECDFIPCEVCGTKAQDVHHIEARGMGGSKTKDYIENLMAVCRACHVAYGDRPQYREMLQGLHIMAMRDRKVTNHN